MLSFQPQEGIFKAPSPLAGEGWVEGCQKNRPPTTFSTYCKTGWTQYQVVTVQTGAGRGLVNKQIDAHGVPESSVLFLVAPAD